ncbi:hypothetical protein BJY01DRAFT_255622 [Aspergillus pseudoustus]|uniref:t-SNARE coiled-coil homology domain-containing protein n=1 Tax=Aspergillus pseudoustus TaxID=1810923 RepID=A0ABR4IIR9_9EURO
MRPTSRNEFTIAIICALPLEADAVEALFDEVYDKLGRSYGKRDGDANSYINGRIGKHNVVLCHMPEMGKVSAAIVSASAKASYRRLELALVVGICGGVPQYKDKEIFLGDAIVADSVVGYGFGKQYPGGFQSKPVSRISTPEVRSFVAALQTGQLRLEFLNRTRSHLRKLRQDNAKWQYPKSSNARDILFETSYHHKHPPPVECSCSDGDNICDEALLDDCKNLGCDESRTVRLRERLEAVNVHFGPVASADTVMKSGEHRDKLAKTHNVIGFEMEGVGVWEIISPCIVVKGVSDYADSHKFKYLQNYAAAAGACAAKAFLECWNPAKQDDYWIVPFERNTKFAGREAEIHQIQLLIDKNDGPKKIALAGLGGIGKTQIALEVAYRMKDRDAEYSVIWIPCGSLESIEQAFVSVTSALGMQGVNPAEAKDAVKAYLSHNVTRWLLILDSVDDLTLWAELRDFLPQSKQGRILVTTRNQRLVTSLDVIPISEPDGETGIDILRYALGDKHPVGDRHTATTLLERLAYLPLAITQAAAYIKYIGPSFRLSDYLELLDEQESKVIELLSADFTEEYGQANPVAGTWLVTFQQIQQSDPSAAEYLSLMACVNSHNIPRAFLPPLASKRETFSAIGLLDSFSLITVQPEKGSLTLHRLVYLVTRSWMRRNQVFSNYLYRAADRLKEIISEFGNENKQQLRQYLPHAMSLINEAEFNVQLKYDDLLWRTAHCQYRDGRYNDAQRLFTSIMELRVKEYGDKNSATLAGMAWVVYTCAKQARLDEAEELGTRVLQTQKQELGEKHPDTLLTMVHLSSIYRNKGEWAQARALHSQLLDVYKEQLGPSHPTTLAAMADLAITCSRHGNREEAESLKLHVLQTRREFLRADHVDTLTSMHSLAREYTFQGRVEEAKRLHGEVVDGGKKALGLDHSLIVASAVALAWIWIDQRDWKLAEDLLLEVFEATSETLGKQNPDTLFAMSNLASVYLGQGRACEAEDLEKQVLETRKELFGREHPETLKSMHDLAKIYMRQGRQEESARLKELAIKIEVKEDILGPNDPCIIDNLDKLAWDWHISGREEEALELKARVVRLRTERHGPDNYMTQWAVKDLVSWQELAKTQRAPASETLQTPTQRNVTVELGSESGSESGSSVTNRYNQQPSYSDRPAYGAGYNQNPYANNAGQQGYGGGSYELSEDPTALLNRCREINDGIREVRSKREGQLAAAQNALLESQTGRDDEAARQALDYIQEEIKAATHKLKDDLQRVKSTPGSNATHVQNQIDVTSRNLRTEIEAYIKEQSAVQKRLTEQVRRRYQMSNPNATPEEVEQGVENVLAGTEQSFQIAGSRTKAAYDTQNAVNVRSAAIRKIEKDMIELAELIQHLAEEIHQQDAAVEQINRDAGNVAQDLENANTQLTGAIDSARKARRWKWYALIIVIIIIAIVVGVAVGVTAK